MLNAEQENGVTLLKMIANWVNSRNPHEETRKQIYGGIRRGGLDHARDGFEVRVRSLWDQGDSEVPTFLALRFKHPETEGSLAGWRFWVTDIGLEYRSIDESTLEVLFSISNSHFIRSGFIGEPGDPGINSPNIVKDIVRCEQWRCYAGPTVLRLDPIEINHGNVKEYAASIFSKERSVPMIFVSTSDDAKYSVDPFVLAKKVVGNAIVAYEAEPSVSAYLNAKPHFDSYRCGHGAVRVYLPNADYSIAGDWRRHRFFLHREIEEVGDHEVTRIIAESLVRRSAFTRHSGIQNIDDLQRLQVERRLQQAIQNKQGAEIIQSYQAQVDSLKHQIEEKDAELKDYCDLYDFAMADIDKLKMDLKALETKNYNLITLNTSLTEELARNAQYQIQPLEEVPTNLQELLKLLETWYPGQVTVLKEAFDSADGYDVRDLKKSWKLLRSIPEQLYRVIFSIDGGDKRAEYSNRTGFDLSMTESKMTKNAKKLADQRTRLYKGKEIDINAHIGFGTRKPNMLRVHFWIDNNEKKIVVGHCGDHLDVFSTRALT